MAEVELLDTGPLVGLIDAREPSHAWAVSAFQRVRSPLWTCQAVLTETCFLLRNQPSALARLRRQVQARGVKTLASAREDAVARPRRGHRQ